MKQIRHDVISTRLLEHVHTQVVRHLPRVAHYSDIQALATCCTLFR